MFATTNPQKSQILYVDDESHNLQSFKSVFRKYFLVHTATSAKEGIELLEKHPIDLVISDQRMPQMSGVDFLERVAKKYPDIGRIIVTGYTDIETSIEAINRGMVYKYIKKPWKHEEFKNAIESALESTRLRKENQILVEKLQKTNKDLDTFIYCISHDLRSPIASLKGLIELARISSNSQEREEIYKLQEKSLEKMDDFIKDIVSYSRNTKAQIQVQKIDFESMTKDIFEQLQACEGAERIDKIIEIDDKMPFFSDKRRLDIILSNLIGNALRYADWRKERLFVKIKIAINSQKATIFVEDNGIGISQEHHAKIFDMFYRANDSKAGSGIGLFIVKETIGKLGGEIRLNSAPRLGTTFILEVPNLYTQYE